MVQVRAEGPKALSPGHRPGHYDNQQERVGQNLRKLSYETTLKVENDFDKNDNNKNRLTPYGASLIVLDFPVTFHQSCLSPLLSSRPW